MPVLVNDIERLLRGGRHSDADGEDDEDDGFVAVTVA